MLTFNEFFGTFEEYLVTLKKIRVNRKKVRRLIKANQVERRKLNKLRHNLKVEVEALELKTTIYRACLDYYGKIDKKFYTLYLLFHKKK